MQDERIAAGLCQCGCGGEGPDSNPDVDHLCRQRACVNPAHMEPVSPAENVRRSRVAKLTLDGARDIRRRSSAGESQYALAAEYGVTQATISSVTRGLTWREGL
jgi:hypothetical protein